MLNLNLLVLLFRACAVILAVWVALGVGLLYLLWRKR
jgi:hypothetical protein